MRFEFRYDNGNKIYLATNYQSFANHFNVTVARIKYMLKTGQINIDKVEITLQDIIRNGYNYQVNASGVVTVEPKTVVASENSSDIEAQSDTDTDTNTDTQEHNVVVWTL